MDNHPPFPGKNDFSPLLKDALNKRNAIMIVIIPGPWKCRVQGCSFDELTARLLMVLLRTHHFHFPVA